VIFDLVHDWLETPDSILTGDKRSRIEDVNADANLNGRSSIEDVNADANFNGRINLNADSCIGTQKRAAVFPERQYNADDVDWP